jgi:hypothetical protein
MKSITSKLRIIILSLFVSAPSLGWADVFDSIANDITHDVTGGYKHLCKVGLDGIINRSIGTSCKDFLPDFVGACNALLDPETMGAGTAMCIAASAEINSQCKGVVEKELGPAVTQAAC